MSVSLPTLYKNWPEIQKSLEELSSNPTPEKLLDTIVNFINRTKRIGRKWRTEENAESSEEFEDTPCVRSLPMLSKILSEEQSFLEKYLPSVLNKVVPQEPSYLAKYLPGICQLALDMPNLFPDGKIEALKRNSEDRVELSRKQVACLLAHMFFCDIVPSAELEDTLGITGHLVGDLAPTGPITFRQWHSWRYHYGPPDAYLKTLFKYFKDVLEQDDAVLYQEKVIYQRLVLKEKVLVLANRFEPLVNVEVHLKGRIGDEENHVEMDFANKDVGFGGGGTQEELILGMSPESCVVVLFNETLEISDAIIIQGARIVGTYSGYGLDVKYTGSFVGTRNWQDRKILAMDAICDPGSVADQVSDSVMKRELRKALAAFQAVRGETVDTGHWGCGAFGGNQGVKALVQVMAASMAGVAKLNFFCFEDEKFHQDFTTCLTLLHENKCTVKQLWDLIKSFELEKDTLGWERFGLKSENENNILIWINKQLNKNSNISFKDARL